MKLKALYILSFLLLAAFYSCSKDNSNPTVVQPVGNVSVFYPGTAGSQFSYSSSVNNVQAGNRVVTIGGITTIKGKQYTTQQNYMTLGTIMSTVNTYYRMTTDSLLFYVDTTGLISFIPASLRSTVTMKAPVDAKVLAVPLNQGSSWPVYSLALASGPFSLNIVQLNALYVGSENLTLNLLNTSPLTKTAEKIHYQLILSIPDSTFDISKIQNKTYDAYGWFVQDIGLVRLDGNAAAVEAITRSSITLADTLKTATEVLTSYSLK
jgi:hypothetical protein